MPERAWRAREISQELCVDTSHSLGFDDAHATCAGHSAQSNYPSGVVGVFICSCFRVCVFVCVCVFVTPFVHVVVRSY